MATSPTGQSVLTGEYQFPTTLRSHHIPPPVPEYPRASQCVPVCPSVFWLLAGRLASVLSSIMSTPVLQLQLLLPLLLQQPGHQVQASALLASHMDVFSDLLENIMYSVIRTDIPGGDDGDDEGDDDGGDDGGDDGEVDDVEPSRPMWRESKSRRRVLRTGVVSGGQATPRAPTARMKTNNNQTIKFFGSKKIVSRQRNRNKEKKIRSRKTVERRDRDRGEHEHTITGAKQNVDERLQKVKHLFELIKVSKKQKTRSQDREENVTSKFDNFPSRGRASARLGDNSNDAILVSRKDKKVSPATAGSALENLYKIAGEDWVKTHIQS